MAWLAGQESEAPGGGAAETLQQFKELSADDQVKFLQIISDPEHAANFIKFASQSTTDVAENFKTKSRSVENVLFESESGESNAETSAEGTAAPSEAAASDTWQDGYGSFGAIRAGDRSSWYVKSDKVLGIKVAQVKISILFHKTTTKIDKIYKAEAGHKNFVPLSEFSNTKPDTWINAAGVAHASTVWTAKLKTGSSWTAPEEVWSNKTGGGGGALN
ncbi:hypothetical protein PV396_19630 [Streptomyces sp. ME02-8801-2C]|nr:hypothetical protein [Streptomyces sp. ME02-8801-2C]